MLLAILRLKHGSGRVGEVSRITLQRRIVAWEASRGTSTSASDPELVSAIEAVFHTTQHDDQTIAHYITSQEILTTQNQAKEIRLAHGWRRHAYDD